MRPLTKTRQHKKCLPRYELQTGVQLFLHLYISQWNLNLQTLKRFFFFTRLNSIPPPKKIVHICACFKRVIKYLTLSSTTVKEKISSAPLIWIFTLYLLSKKKKNRLSFKSQFQYDTTPSGLNARDCSTREALIIAAYTLCFTHTLAHTSCVGNRNLLHFLAVLVNAITLWRC